VKRSPEQPESYVLRGGKAGAARLRLINRVKWPTTERLLSTAGLRAGMRVLDLGCGGGAVTLKIAALVGQRARSWVPTRPVDPTAGPTGSR
jgi:SAM-dependent methyltransferase